MLYASGQLILYIYSITTLYNTGMCVYGGFLQEVYCMAPPLINIRI